MSEVKSRLGRTIVNLLLAMLNATLIIVAVCLYLEFRVLKEIDGITATFSENLIKIEPLRASVDKLSNEASGLRVELAELRASPRKIVTPATEELLTKRIDELNSQLTQVKAKFNGVIENPEILIDYAIEKGVNELASGLANLRGCGEPPNT